MNFQDYFLVLDRVGYLKEGVEIYDTSGPGQSGTFEHLDSEQIAARLLDNIKSGFCIVVPSGTPFFHTSLINLHTAEKIERGWECLIENWKLDFKENLLYDIRSVEDQILVTPDQMVYGGIDKPFSWCHPNFKVFYQDRFTEQDLRDLPDPCCYTDVDGSGCSCNEEEMNRRTIQKALSLCAKSEPAPVPPGPCCYGH